MLIFQHTKVLLCIIVTYVLLPVFLTAQSTGTVVISGELKKWHKVTITFDGPSSSETNTTNPFLSYRLSVTFTHHSGKSYKVPGYYAADGNAGETSASSGNKWRVHFAPDAAGDWTYIASFRKGTNIAVSDVVDAGTAISPINGARGSFSITSSDKTGKDLRSKGRLKYVGAAFLQFPETGEYFRKAGSDSPENFFAYQDFDNTPDNGGRRKTWSPHIQDWVTGNPTWQGGKGKGIIGSVNYLSNQGLNAFSFLTMNINGDDGNVFPYINTSDFTRIDISKLDQWEIVLDHAQKMGLYLHFKMQERENDNLLDGGELGTKRKMYCRELIARFSHHLALNWNVGEENTQTDKQRKDMAKYLHTQDPYKHIIVIHTYPGKQEEIYRPLLGSASEYTGISIQTDVSNVYAETRKWVEASTSSGKKWIVANDEQNLATVGVAADAEYSGNRGSVADNSEQIRKSVLWGNFMAGGAGVEYYFGYNTGETDLTCQDLLSRAKSWRYAKYAVEFFKAHLSLIELKPLRNVSRGWSLGKDGVAYVVYLPSGGSSNITLPSGNYTVKWYNPRTGGALQNGTVTTVTSGTVSIGYPPSSTTSDWIALLKNSSTTTASTYQAENYTAQNGITISADNSGYTGTGYADYGGNGTWIEWNNVPKSSGTATLTLYYANGSGADRPCSITVNGSAAGNLNFSKTASWSAWQTATINIPLYNTSNTVRVVASTSNGGPNLDKMEVSSNAVTAALKIAAEKSISNVLVYPNPASEIVNIISNLGAVINIYNIQGVKIFSNKYAGKRETINLSRFGSGIYFIELVNDGKKITQKVIVSRQRN